MTFSSDTAAAQQLAGLFESELDCLRELRDILALERAALLDRDIPALEEVTGRKVRILERHSDAARQRREWLARTGQELPGSPDAVSADVNLRTQELQELAQQCHEANRNNGRVIARKQQHAAAALGILRQSDAAVPATYSGAGNTVDTSSSRLLGKA